MATARPPKRPQQAPAPMTFEMLFRRKKIQPTSPTSASSGRPQTSGDSLDLPPTPPAELESPAEFPNLRVVGFRIKAAHLTLDEPKDSAIIMEIRSEKLAKMTSTKLHVQAGPDGATFNNITVCVLGPTPGNNKAISYYNKDCTFLPVDNDSIGELGQRIPHNIAFKICLDGEEFLGEYVVVVEFQYPKMVDVESIQLFDCLFRITPEHLEDGEGQCVQMGDKTFVGFRIKTVSFKLLKPTFVPVLELRSKVLQGIPCHQRGLYNVNAATGQENIACLMKPKRCRNDLIYNLKGCGYFPVIEQPIPHNIDFQIYDGEVPFKFEECVVVVEFQYRSQQPFVNARRTSVNLDIGL